MTKFAFGQSWPFLNLHFNKTTCKKVAETTEAEIQNAMEHEEEVIYKSYDL